MRLRDLWPAMALVAAFLFASNGKTLELAAQQTAGTGSRTKAIVGGTLIDGTGRPSGRGDRDKGCANRLDYVGVERRAARRRRGDLGSREIHRSGFDRRPQPLSKLGGRAGSEPRRHKRY